MLAIPLMCCTLTHLGTVVALRPNVLHFSLLVCPVKILSRSLWSECSHNPNFVKEKEHFLINIKH